MPCPCQHKGSVCCTIFSSPPLHHTLPCLNIFHCKHSPVQHLTFPLPLRMVSSLRLVFLLVIISQQTGLLTSLCFYCLNILSSHHHRPTCPNILHQLYLILP